MIHLYKKYFLCAAAALLTLCCAHSEAATLHAILIGDTLGDNIQESVIKDLDNMQKEVGLISRYTHLSVKEMVITGENITKNLLKELDQAQIETDDVVLFYYSGHGYREDSKESIWPNFYITQQDKGIKFDEVQEILKNKNPRFLLAMADCCNSFIPDDYAPQMIHKDIKATSREQLEKNYQKLFLEQRGYIFVSSSSIGEPSWGMSSRGGLYTYTFLLNLHRSVKSTAEMDWNVLLEGVREELIGDQTPQFLIEVPS
jgi:hypothetical protein